MATAQSTSASLARPAPVSLFDRKPFYTLLATTGFALLIIAGLVVALIGVLSGDLAETAMFVGFLLVPGLLGVVLSWKVGRWGFILPELLALALMVLFVPFLPFTLAHPEGGLEFIMAAVFVAGALLAVVGGGVSIVQWLRRTATTGATPAQRMALQVVLSALVVVVVASLTLTALARTTLAADVKAGATPVAIKNFDFAVHTLTAKPGDTVRLAVRNDDSALHTFTLPEAGVNVTIPAGAERLIEFQAPAAGTYTWYCVPHSNQGAAGREGMVGKLTVAP
jgi:plastocyanin